MGLEGGVCEWGAGAADGKEGDWLVERGWPWGRVGAGAGMRGWCGGWGGCKGMLRFRASGGLEEGAVRLCTS